MASRESDTAMRITLPQCGTEQHESCPGAFAGRECACECHATAAPRIALATTGDAPAEYSNGVNRASETVDVARWCVDNRIPSYIVGSWVWAEFDGKPATETRDALKGAGFRWNERRKVWQHSGGTPSRRSSRDPRATYGAVHNFKNGTDDDTG